MFVIPKSAAVEDPLRRADEEFLRLRRKRFLLVPLARNVVEMTERH